MIKILFIIGVILSANMTLASDNLDTNDVDAPHTAALNIIEHTLEAMRTLKVESKVTPEIIKTLIGKKLLPNIAIDVSTQIALKKHWHNLDQQQKQLFQDYITQSLIKDYAGVFGSYDKLDSIKVSVNPEVKRKDNKAIVKLTFKFDNESAPFLTSVKMIYSDRWRVYDVVFSGVSLIKNYRAQFNSHIKRKGLDSLTKKIAKKMSKILNIPKETPIYQSKYFL